MRQRTELLQVSAVHLRTRDGSDSSKLEPAASLVHAGQARQLPDSIGQAIGSISGTFKAAAGDVAAEVLARGLNVTLDRLGQLVDDFAGQCRKGKESLMSSMTEAVEEKLPLFESQAHQSLTELANFVGLLTNGVLVADTAVQAALSAAGLGDLIPQEHAAMAAAGQTLFAFAEVSQAAAELLRGIANMTHSRAEQQLARVDAALDDGLHGLDVFADNVDQAFWYVADAVKKKLGASPAMDKAFRLVQEKADAIAQKVPPAAKEAASGVDDAAALVGLHSKKAEQGGGTRVGMGGAAALAACLGVGWL